MKLTRCLAVAAVAMASSMAGLDSAGADWREDVPVFRIGILGGDLEERRLGAFACLMGRVRRALGVQVELLPSRDYTGIAEGLLSGRVQAAGLNAAGYARISLQDPDAVEPIAALQQEDGTLGYRSVLIVRADSPYQTLADLRGRSLVFTERLSTSGFLIPYYELTKQGYRPDQFFGRVAFTGGHRQAVSAVLNGEADAGVTWSSGTGEHDRGYSRGNLRRMVERGSLDMSDVRVLWTSELIPAGPQVVRKDLPDEAKEIYQEVLLNLADDDRLCFTGIVGDNAVDFAPITHADYEAIINISRSGARGSDS